MTSESRAQRLVDEFEEGAAFAGGHSIRHGIAAVLRHLADTDSAGRRHLLRRATGKADEESFYTIPARTLEDLAAALTAPSLLERALAGDAAAARQFLREAGFTDERGQLLPQYQPEESQS